MNSKYKIVRATNLHLAAIPAIESAAAAIFPEADLPLDVTVFSRDGCSYCAKAKGLLHYAGIEFDELVLNQDFAESTIRAVSGHVTVPQVFINGALIGGSEELQAYLAHADAA